MGSEIHSEENTAAAVAAAAVCGGLVSKPLRKIMSLNLCVFSNLEGDGASFVFEEKVKNERFLVLGFVLLLTSIF